MIYNYPYLNDKDFLEKILSSHLNEYFVKIITLDWQENPIQNIQSRVVSANFSIDGSSSVRRTGNISLILDENDQIALNVNNLFSINKKISVQIGYVNNSPQKYLDYQIIWFPMGIYVINNVSLSHEINQLTVSLQLKDKMCLLNGQLGGVIPASTVFDNYITIDSDGNEIISRPTIYQIIQELVNHFGGEQLGKIIISDLDTRVKEAMKWAGSSPLYVVQKNSQIQMTISSEQYLEWTRNQGWEDFAGSPFEYGYDVGYTFTDFSYPGQLICDAGAAVTDVLDQIVATLNNYQYFYDLNGNFIFQEIKNYLNNSQSKIALQHLKTQGNIEASDYLIDNSNGKSVYSFKDSNLVTSYNNTPQFNMIKNDFVIWGIRKTSTGAEIPIRYHLAIDKKPDTGNTYLAFSYEDPDDHIIKWHCPITYISKSHFPKTGAKGIFYYDQAADKIYIWDDDGTGNNTYIITDATIERVTTKDWRTQLYFQGVSAEPFGTDSNYYYTELINEWPKIYDIKANEIGESNIKAYNNIYAVPQTWLRYNTVGTFYYCTTNNIVYKCIARGTFTSENYQAQDMSNIYIPENVTNYTYINLYYLGQVNKSSFKESTLQSPVNIDYFLDFIDSNEKVAEYDVNNIGRRSYIINDNNINCVFEPDIPDIILIRLSDSMAIDPITGEPITEMAKIRQECQQRGQNYYQVPDTIYDALTIGGAFNSGYNFIRQAFHQYTSYNESISISCLPLYFLQPNTRISVYDSDSGINGDYMISTISITLGINNNSMTINGIKALEKL